MTKANIARELCASMFGISAMLSIAIPFFALSLAVGLASERKGISLLDRGAKLSERVANAIHDSLIASPFRVGRGNDLAL